MVQTGAATARIGAAAARSGAKAQRGTGGTQPGAPDGLRRPKLVVGIVVDQMRWDYLYRYYDRYEGGLKRLLTEGFSCENTLISHLPSFTAVGHSTIFTGSVPAFHGITGNNWIDQQTGRNWYCTEDTLMQTVGSTSAAGKMSPRNLLASTITDELRLATNFRSKVVGVSLKDRASILPAGHMPTGAFWFDDASGRFITSTWYMNELPDWVRQFNSRDEPSRLVAGGWNTLYPIGTYAQSEPDDVSWEGTFKGEKSPVFPHDIAAYYKRSHEVIRSTPFGNSLTLAFAKAAVEGYNLGQGTSTDFLTINCASTDYVGHMYGPNSIEVEDTYLRLDKDLGAFFAMLDQKVGKGNYLIFLTADHGAAHSIDFLKEHHLGAGWVDMNGMVKQLNDSLGKAFGVTGILRSGINYHLNFDMNRIRAGKLDYRAIKKYCIDYLLQQPGIQYAIDIENIREQPIPEPLLTMIVNGYNSKRCGPIIVIPDPGWFEGAKKGTTHGNWNAYDTHIPLVFMGWGIRHGQSNHTCYMTDIAPTVAAMLHIQMPSGCVGTPIEAVCGQARMEAVSERAPKKN